jgi:tripartite-type tricarboxylate transporter receptor subunit TctC
MPSSRLWLNELAIEQDTIRRNTVIAKQIVWLALIASTVEITDASLAQAQDWPIRPVTMVVTFAAGSADDVLARTLSPHLSNLLGQQVIVENIAGAGGMNGASRVANAVPDGYQFVLGGIGTFAANQTLYKHPLYNAATDFTPVALVAEQPMLLVARNHLPAATLPEFATYAKANQGRMKFGSGGSGSATHLACVLLNAALDINVTHVPYRSALLGAQDMIAGRIDFACPVTSTWIGLVETNQVKAIAILSKNRTAALPKLASANEQGLVDFDANIWNGIFLPKATPAGIVNKLHQALVATMNEPAVQDRINQLGGSIVAAERRSPEYLQKFVESEIRKWGGPIKASGVSMD